VVIWSGKLRHIAHCVLSSMHWMHSPFETHSIVFQTALKTRFVVIFLKRRTLVFCLCKRIRLFCKPKLYILFCQFLIVVTVTFSALMLLVRCQEELLACENWVMRCWSGYISGGRCRWFACGHADGTATSSLASCKPRLVILSSASLTRLSWKGRHKMDVCLCDSSNNNP